MPYPINGGYPKPGDLRGQLAQMHATDAQLQRLMTQPPKTPKPPTGGGIVDVASVYTSAYVGIAWPSGASDLNFGSASYSVQSEAGDTSWLSVTGGDIAVTQDGYYQAWCYVDLRWSSQAAAPGSFLSVFINGDPDVPGNGAAYFPTYQAGTLWGIVQPVTNGPEYLTAGQYWRLEADAGTPSSAAITKSAASWRITRYA